MIDNQLENSNVSEQRKKRSRILKSIGILFSGMAIVVLIIVGGLASHKFFIVNTDLSKMILNLQSRVSESQASVQQIQQTVAGMQQATQQTAEELKTQTQAIAEMRQAAHSSKDDLQVAEAEFLVKTANNNLQFENNVALAIKLLQLADQSIAKVTDPRLYTVREALSADLVALQNAPQIDVNGVYLKLSALGDQVDKLPVINQFVSPEKNSTEIDAKMPWWKRGLQATGQALQKLVVVHKGTTPLPFVAPDQQVFLYENLRSELEKAEWALLHRQQDIYQESLQRASDWIKKYVVQDAPMTQQVLTQLTQLQQLNVSPATIALTGSLQALQNYFNLSGK